MLISTLSIIFIEYHSQTSASSSENDTNSTTPPGILEHSKEDILSKEKSEGMVGNTDIDRSKSNLKADTTSAANEKNATNYEHWLQPNPVPSY